MISSQCSTQSIRLNNLLECFSSETEKSSAWGGTPLKDRPPLDSSHTMNTPDNGTYTC